MHASGSTKRSAIGLVIAIVILGTIAHAADNPGVSKGAALLCFVLLAVLFFILPAKRSVDPVDTDDDNEDSGLQSLPARLAWAAWMSLSAVACFGIAELAGTMLPPLAVPLRAVGVVILVVAAYKLFFGRRRKNSDIDF